ncbi:MAG: hypothetical protein ACOX3S_10690 [Anaerolineae bacterium]|jgi:hypothetical protein
MTINPNWPYIAVIAGLLAAAYAGLIAWLNNHRRHGTFWGAHAWLEVVIGNSLIILTLWALAGREAALLVFGLNALWGAPMVITTLLANMRRLERAVDQAGADAIARRSIQ